MIQDYIKINRFDNAATEAKELLDYIRILRDAYERGVAIRAKMQHNFDDSGGENAIDWEILQGLYGIPAGGGTGANESVGPNANGARVYTFMNGSVGAMEGVFQTNAAKTITETVG